MQSFQKRDKPVLQTVDAPLLVQTSVLPVRSSASNFGKILLL
jgi:hypothetical protein